MVFIIVKPCRFDGVERLKSHFLLMTLIRWKYGRPLRDPNILSLVTWQTHVDLGSIYCWTQVN
jgi:hypothetical protein